MLDDNISTSLIDMTSVVMDDNQIDMDMHERLQWARERAGWKSRNSAAIALGWNSSTYGAHENGQNPFRESAAKQYGKAFGVSWRWLLTGGGTPEPSEDELAEYAKMPEMSPAPTRPKPNVSSMAQHQRMGGDRAIPLKGQTVGGPNGRFVFNGQTVDYVFCPPNLLNVDDAYAVRIYGTSMEPRYKAGETVWLNPIEPVRSGDDVVVQILHGDDDQPDSYIKEFVSQSAKVLRLRQLNPDDGEGEILEFPTEKVFSVHKVVFHAKA